MSTRIATQRLAAIRPLPTQCRLSTSISRAPQRGIAESSRPSPESNKDNKKDGEDLSNPLLEKYLTQAESNAEKGRKPQVRLREGSPSNHPSSLFLPEREIPGWRPDLSDAEKAAWKSQLEAQKTLAKRINELKLSEMTLDPDARARRKLERKLVIGNLTKRGRLTKAQTIARTERQSLYKSQNLPTSTKKLQKVVNQIAGKTVSEALVQLRFSKKRVARDVIKGLEMAQNEAIVARGMSLGGSAATLRWQQQRKNADLGRIKDMPVPKGQTAAKPTMIEMKDGSKKMVRDPTEIYIDQAWVGKGETWKTPEYRARGRVNLLRHRTTSFSVLLKEEKTRIRLSEEIKKKRENRKLWVALPDRPVTTQRQYCLW